MNNTKLIILLILAGGGAVSLVIFFSVFWVFIPHAPSPVRSGQGQPEEMISAVAIPLGASLQDSPKNFEPSDMNVTIGVNNKVRWANDDSVQVSVLADDDSDPGFFNATHDSSGDPTLASSLYPSEIFEYTFTKPGTYGYHCSFHPWMRGSVTVLSGQ